MISSIGDALSLLRAERERTVPSRSGGDRRADGRGRARGRSRPAPAPATSRSGSRTCPSGARCGRSPPARSGSRPARRPGAPSSTTDATSTRSAPATRDGVAPSGPTGSSPRRPSSGCSTATATTWCASTARWSPNADLERGHRPTHTRYRGPITLRPTVWTIDGRRIIELNAVHTRDERLPGQPDVTYIVGRSR